MNTNCPDAAPEWSDEDLREAVRELKTYVDITEEDLKRIYTLALRHARERIRTRMPVREIMTKRAVAVRQDSDIHEASRLLSENKISGMPVVDEAGLVLGVISEADLLSLAGVKKGHTFKDIVRHILGDPVPRGTEGNTVRDVMSSPAITATPDMDIKDAAEILDQRRIKRLPVIDAEGKLIGIISRADIVKAIGKRS